MDAGRGKFVAGAVFFIAAGFLRATAFFFAAGFFLATTFFAAVFLSFFTTAFLLAADFLRAGLDFLAASDLLCFAFFAVFFRAAFLFLAMDCLLSILKRHHAKSAVNLSTAAGVIPAVSSTAARDAAGAATN